jgi:hypothetical protein
MTGENNLPRAIGLTDTRADEILNDVKEISKAASDENSVLNAAVAIQNIVAVYTGFELAWAMWCLSGICHYSRFRRGGGRVIIVDRGAG